LEKKPPGFFAATPEHASIRRIALSASAFSQNGRQQMGVKKDEDDLVDAGSEYSFPASDPPSYMGGSAVAGPPPHEEGAREPVNEGVTNPDEVKPAEDAPQDTDPAQAGKAPKPEDSGGNNA
jgi:hypothetical protein